MSWKRVHSTVRANDACDVRIAAVADSSCKQAAGRRLFQNGAHQMQASCDISAGAMGFNATAIIPTENDCQHIIIGSSGVLQGCSPWCCGAPGPTHLNTPSHHQALPEQRASNATELLSPKTSERGLHRPVFPIEPQGRATQSSCRCQHHHLHKPLHHGQEASSVWVV
jgi:hypothetical protein